MPDTLEHPIIDTVMSEVPGVSRDHVRMQMFNAARTLCSRAGVWRHIYDTKVRDGSHIYNVLPPAYNAGVLAVSSVSVDGRTVPILPYNNDFATVAVLEFSDATRIRLYNVPDIRIGKPLQICTVLTPVELEWGDEGGVMPTALEQRFSDYLRYQTLANLMGEIGKPYSNQTLHIHNYRMANAYMGDAKNMADQNGAYKPSGSALTRLRSAGRL